MPRIVVILLIIVVYPFIGYGFLQAIDAVNLPVIATERKTRLVHPEFLPSARSVRIVSAGYDAIIADSYWLYGIHYIGSTVVETTYKQYLATILDLVTDIHPSFTVAYRMGQILIPAFDRANERLREIHDDHLRHAQEGFLLGKKGIAATCDPKRLSRISRTTSGAIDTTLQPCLDPIIPYYQGFINALEFQNYPEASYDYRIAASDPNAPDDALAMSVVTAGRSNGHFSSAILFLSLAIGTSNDTDPYDTISQTMIRELGTVLSVYTTQSGALSDSWRILANAEVRIRASVTASGTDLFIDGMTILTHKSLGFALMALKELQFFVIESQDARFLRDRRIHAASSEELYDERYIVALPTNPLLSNTDGASLPLHFEYDPKRKEWVFFL